VIRACIFDLDGVIVDTAKYHFLAWKRLAYELGIEFTENDNERLKGVSRIKSLEIILELGGVTLNDEEKLKCTERKNGWFLDYVNAMQPDEIFPGAVKLLQDLKSNSIKIALASSSQNAQTILDHLQIKDLFEVVVDGTMINYSKPDPEIFLLSATHLGIDPTNCLVFEDAEAGVMAALSAGMKCVGVGKISVLGNADMVVSNIGEFGLDRLKSFEDEISVHGLKPNE
jgi:beta-phosphoglucomutase